MIVALDGGDDDVRMAAVRALGALGTIGAVAPMARTVNRNNLLLLALDAVDAAITRIQGRLSGAVAGQIALAPAGKASGQVNLAQPDATDR